jgi:uncharacterized metal-binding protein YceD (DUF177 family)
MQDTQETTEPREATPADLDAFAQRTGRRFTVQGTPLTVVILICPRCGTPYGIRREEHAANQSQGREPMCLDCREPDREKDWETMCFTVE